MRATLLKAIGEVEKGRQPLHIVRDHADNAFTHIDACQVTIAQATDWRDVLPHLAQPKAVPGAPLPNYHDLDKHLKRET